MSQQSGQLGWLMNALGKKPPQLARYVGQEVRIEAEGLGPFNAILDEGPFNYVARGNPTLHLYAGMPVKVTAEDGTVVDFRNVQM